MKLKFYLDADHEQFEPILGQLMAKQIELARAVGDYSQGLTVDEQIEAFDFVGRYFCGSEQFDLYLKETCCE